MKTQLYFKAVIVGVLLVATFWVRTYRLYEPLGDWHSWRQADTAAVARNFIQEDFNLMYPKSDSLWALNERQLPNPNRYFMNEFPLYNAIVALAYKMYGINHVYGRIVSIGFATVGAFALFGVTATLLGYWQGVAVLIIYAVLPYNVYYGRVVMPDPAFVSLSIIALYWCVRYVKTKSIVTGLFMSISLALAMLVKPYAVFMVIPIVYWIVANQGLRALFNPVHFGFLAIAFAPIFAWRYFLSLHPEGSFASKWLLNGDGIRFKGSFFRWMIYDRLNRLIFATGGFALFVIGFIRSYITKPASFFFVWTLAVFAYFTVFAKGNVNHDYYQLPIVAPGVVLMVIGIEWILKNGKTIWQRLLGMGIAVSLVIIMLAFGWFGIRMPDHPHRER